MRAVGLPLRVRSDRLCWPGCSGGAPMAGGLKKWEQDRQPLTLAKDTPETSATTLLSSTQT